jgi:hypothetical protein
MPSTTIRQQTSDKLDAIDIETLLFHPYLHLDWLFFTTNLQLYIWATRTREQAEWTNGEEFD